MSYTGKIEDLIAERDELRAALTAVSDSLDYLHGMTPQQAAELRKNAERYRKICEVPGALDAFTAAYYNTQTQEQLNAAVDAVPAVG